MTIVDQYKRRSKKKILYYTKSKVWIRGDWSDERIWVLFGESTRLHPGRLGNFISVTYVSPYGVIYRNERHTRHKVINVFTVVRTINDVERKK